jgi:hypothetical protein
VEGTFGQHSILMMHFSLPDSIATKLEWNVEKCFHQGSPYTLDTKYYTATIEFWICAESDVPFEPLSLLVESLVYTFEPKQVCEQLFSIY